MNSVHLVGRLTKDPEITYTQNGKAVAKFGLAVDNPFKKDENGNRGTDFFNVSAWGNEAENAGKYLTKGQRAGVEGRIEVRQYTDREGQRRTSVDVVANRVHYYDKPGGRDQGGGQQQGYHQQQQRQGGYAQQAQPQYQDNAQDMGVDDLPF